MMQEDNCFAYVCVNREAFSSNNLFFSFEKTINYKRNKYVCYWLGV